MSLYGCMLFFLIGKSIASLYVKRMPYSNQNGFINIFRNGNKLCEKSYCLLKNGLCNDYSCCDCKCSYDTNAMYLGFQCVDSKAILDNIGATLIDKLHFVYNISNGMSQDIPFIQQPQVLETVLFAFKTPAGDESTVVEKCSAGTLYYLDFISGLMKEYFKNTCEQMVKVELKQPTKIQLSVRDASDWNGMSGRIMVFMIKCSLSNKKLVNGSLVFQFAGAEGSFLRKLPSTSGMHPGKCDPGEDLFNERNNAKDENGLTGSKRLLVGVLCGLSVLLLLVLVGIAYTCRVSKKNKRRINTRKRPSCRENEYMQATLVAPCTEDGGGYLLPVECLTPRPEECAASPALKDSEGKTLLDADGYVALTAVQKEALLKPS